MKKVLSLLWLTKKVKFCKKTLISNRRPYSSVEFIQKKNSTKKTIKFDKNGVSESWSYSRLKKELILKENC